MAKVDPIGLATVVPISTGPTASNLPYTHSIKKSVANGLSMDSTAMVFHIKSVDHSRLSHKMGTLEKTHKDAIITLIQEYLGLAAP